MAKDENFEKSGFSSFAFYGKISRGGGIYEKT